jgi:dolichol-phosphate mannosyltransferase
LNATASFERRAPVELSVVIPVYGCAGCISQLCRQVSEEIGDKHYELILVDDRSPDGAWSVICDLTRVYPIRAIRLSRNFGQHAAITAGLAEAAGVWTVVMDCDLQDRPEELPRLLEAAREGHDIVFARRKARRHSWYRRWAARLYVRLVSMLTGSRIEGEYGTYSILSRKVVDAYLTLGDTSRHYLFILNWLGFDSTSIDVDHGERKEGKSAYNFRRLLRHALDGLVFQTTVLLQWIVYAGFAVALGGVALAVVLISLSVLSTPPPGWTSLAVLILLIGGFIIISTGVAGLYIGKIFDQVKGRPLYVIDERFVSPLSSGEVEPPLPR